MKIIAKKVFKEGECITYQDMIEVYMGNFLAKNLYKLITNESDFFKEENGLLLEPYEKYFKLDSDYEIIIKKK
ncbi:MAG: hypothetical protein ACM31H_00980 [Nitrososphaerales archaeon]